MSGLSATIEPVNRLSPARLLVRDDRLRIAGRDVDQIEVGIVGDRLPGHAAAVLHRLFVRPGLGAGLAHLLRHDVPAPLHLAGLRIVRLEVAGHVEVVAADAGDDVVLDDHRRHRAVVELVEIADLLAPALLAVLDVQRHEMAVGRLEVQRVAEHRDAAVADVDAALRLPGVVPQLAAGARVERPHVIGRGEVDHAVDLQRRALDRHAAAAARRRAGTSRPRLSAVDVRRR